MLRKQSENTPVTASLARNSDAWVVPYVDQPVDFWQKLHAEFGNRIRAVYFPLQDDLMGTGRPKQNAAHLADFLRESIFPANVLINSITLPAPMEEVAPRVVEALRRLHNECDLQGVTLTDLRLARHVRDQIPELTIVASVLMDIARPHQVAMLEGICDVLAPASRVMRDLSALRELRDAFQGRIRLLLNEGCLADCPFRVQHFHEMGSNVVHPHSLCQGLLERHPWMRLTGAWVLPQHLHLYSGLYDELKLAGRVSLRDPEVYVDVLRAYANRKHTAPNRIGAGPASLLNPLDIEEDFFRHTLACGHVCHDCDYCCDYYKEAVVRHVPELSKS